MVQRLWIFVIQNVLEEFQGSALELLSKLDLARKGDGFRSRVSAMPTRSNGSVEAEASQGEEGQQKQNLPLRRTRLSIEAIARLRHE